jgi:nucleotide-binding universal stress UspA family protein
VDKMNVILNDHRPLRLLVAVDFSDCCRHALKSAIQFIDSRPVEMFLLHVIDERLINACIKLDIDNEAVIKKRLFKDAKEKLDAVVEEEHLTAFSLHKIICRGLPYKEINRQAEKFDIDIIVMGSCGMAGDLDAIFFGGTAERLMRFITKPVFCVPPNGKKKEKGKKDAFSG